VIVSFYGMLEIEKMQVITNICNQLSSYIQLPPLLEVELKPIAAYGETVLSFRKMNKIILNSDLSAKELFYPTIHELVHVHQIYTGKLAVSRTGVFIWNNRTYIVDPLTMQPSDYQQLPWEQDAQEQQVILAKKLLEKQALSNPANNSK
jgi:hypothetical protein